jgi:hypothetical protein
MNEGFEAPEGALIRSRAFLAAFEVMPIAVKEFCFEAAFQNQKQIPPA